MRIDRVKFVAELTRRDMNLKQLCKKAGLSRATATAVKTGKACSTLTAEKIAAALEIDVEQLIAKEG